MPVGEKPALDEALLAHYGIKGMKWGVRQGKGTTGIARRRTAIIDRNDRTISRIENARAGKGLMRDRVALAIDRKILGKSFQDKYLNTQLDDLRSQNARLKTGRLTFTDKVRTTMMVTPIDLLVSVRPK